MLDVYWVMEMRIMIAVGRIQINKVEIVVNFMKMSYVVVEFKREE